MHNTAVSVHKEQWQTIINEHKAKHSPAYVRIIYQQWNQMFKKKKIKNSICIFFLTIFTLQGNNKH